VAYFLLGHLVHSIANLRMRANCCECMHCIVEKTDCQR